MDVGADVALVQLNNNNNNNNNNNYYYYYYNYYYYNDNNNNDINEDRGPVTRRKEEMAKRLHK